VNHQKPFPKMQWSINRQKLLKNYQKLGNQILLHKIGFGGFGIGNQSNSAKSSVAGSYGICKNKKHVFNNI